MPCAYKAIEIALGRLDNFGMALASVDHSDARRRNETAAAPDIPDFRIRGPVRVDLSNYADAARDGIAASFGFRSYLCRARIAAGEEIRFTSTSLGRTLAVEGLGQSQSGNRNAQ